MLTPLLIPIIVLVRLPALAVGAIAINVGAKKQHPQQKSESGSTPITGGESSQGSNSQNDNQPE